MSLLSFTIAFFFVCCICLLFVYIRQLRSFRQYRDIAENVHQVNDLNGLIGIIQRELSRRKNKVFTYLQRNVSAKKLAAANIEVDLFEPNAIARAFFTVTPHDLSANNDIDKKLIDKYGNHITAIPLQLKDKGACWKLTNCDVKTKCKCNRKAACQCWVESGKMHKEGEKQHYKEKLTKCLDCKAFLPFGVFLADSVNAQASTRYINEMFSGFLNSSIKYEAVVYSAMYDPLTNIKNKRSFLQDISSSFAFAKRQKLPLSLSMFDIDHFKKFNDSYGHQEGDRLLKELAAFIKQSLRESDQFARYGGEEFAIIFPATSKDEGAAAAEKVRSAVEGKVFCDNKKITISMGISNFPIDNPDNTDDFIRKADAALYASKTTRNAVTAYQEGMTVEKKQPSAVPAKNDDTPKPKKTKKTSDDAAGQQTAKKQDGLTVADNPLPSATTNTTAKELSPNMTEF